MGKNITLYHQDGCGQCKMVKMLLDKNKIEYDSCNDIDVMLELGVHHTPTLEVNGEFLVGKQIFDYINSVRG